ncbi:Hsp20/alpha crystallin family protein [Candidatus Uhrbacteria bacterium]|nr:Hsp20/alpha crystallin family protein [Candidatus Uhrbacteria bacterium]
MKKSDKESDPSQVIGGALDILGIKIDLGKLLSSPEEVKDRLQELREKLKRAGGKEVLTDEEWQREGASIRGHVKTSGVLGEGEYHIGTGARPRGQHQAPKTQKPPGVVEPTVDVFDEPQEIVIVAEVPGVSLNDLELKIQDRVLSLFTRPEARMGYRKEIELSSEVDAGSLKATCHNGILEVRLRKKSGKSR